MLTGSPREFLSNLKNIIEFVLYKHMTLRYIPEEYIKAKYLYLNKY